MTGCLGEVESPWLAWVSAVDVLQAWLMGDARGKPRNVGMWAGVHAGRDQERGRSACVCLEAQGGEKGLQV